MQYTCEQPAHDGVVVVSTTELFLTSNTHPAFVVVEFFSLQHPLFPRPHRFIAGFATDWMVAVKVDCCFILFSPHRLIIIIFLWHCDDHCRGGIQTPGGIVNGTSWGSGCLEEQDPPDRFIVASFFIASLPHFLFFAFHLLCTGGGGHSSIRWWHHNTKRLANATSVGVATTQIHCYSSFLPQILFVCLLHSFIVVFIFLS